MKKAFKHLGISILICIVILAILNNKTFNIGGREITPHLCEKSIGLKMDGQEEITLYWRNGGFLGKQYYSNGNTKMNCNFTIMNSSITEELPCILYYENGNIQTEGNFANGKQEGLRKQYYESGFLMAEIRFSNGNIDDSKCYDEKGKEFVCEFKL